MITRGFTDNRIITRGMGRSFLEKVIEAVCTFKKENMNRLFYSLGRQRIFKKGC